MVLIEAEESRAPNRFLLIGGAVLVALLLAVAVGIS